MASIRSRTNEDLPTCVEIIKAVYHDSGYPVGGVDQALEELQADDRAWVAEDNGEIIGHVAMNKARETYVNVALWLEKHPQTTTTNIALLARLFVHPEARRRGAATMLIRAVEEAARGEEKRLLILALVKDQDAIRLYRRLGWQYYGTGVFRWSEGKEMDAECFVSPLS
ncbi:acyl-CoA N-acyltransferase [Xylaria flabelliformis]|nr:acyl-CoA N-acyltransferase [Xylaria flabelliformis]